MILRVTAQVRGWWAKEEWVADRKEVGSCAVARWAGARPAAPRPACQAGTVRRCVLAGTVLRTEMAAAGEEGPGKGLREFVFLPHPRCQASSPLWPRRLHMPSPRSRPRSHQPTLHPRPPPTVNVDNMAFGQPSKCLQLQPEKAAALRDQVNMSIRNGSNKTLAMVWVSGWVGQWAGPGGRVRGRVAGCGGKRRSARAPGNVQQCGLGWLGLLHTYPVR